MPSRVSENTTLPLKIVVPIALSIMAGTWTVGTMVSGVRSEMMAVNRQLDELNRKMDGVWTRNNMYLWVTKFQRDNPPIKIPAAREGIE